MTETQHDYDYVRETCRQRRGLWITHMGQALEDSDEFLILEHIDDHERAAGAVFDEVDFLGIPGVIAEALRFQRGNATLHRGDTPERDGIVFSARDDAEGFPATLVQLDNQ